MHLNAGKLRAYHDRELSPSERQRVHAHLSQCPRCQKEAENLQRRAAEVEARFTALAPTAKEAASPLGIARARLQAHLSQKEKIPMFQKIFARPYRPAWVGLTIVLILAISLAFPSVRALAVSFLGLFRVEQITFIPSDNLDETGMKLSNSAQFQSLFEEDIQYEPIGEYRKNITADEASALAGLTLRLPTDKVSGETVFTAQAGSHLTYTVNLSKLRSILQEIGREDILLPDNLDGASVTLDLPIAILAEYGDCNYENYSERKTPWLPHCTQLVQLASPTISAPAGLDVTQLGKAFLQLAGMSETEATQISQTVDWTTTLVLPVPTNYGASYHDVMVDGVNGTLITQSIGTPNGRSTLTTLLWVKDGVLFSLNHPGYTLDALAIANSLK